MPSFTLDEIKTYTNCTILAKNIDVFNGVSTDTRKITDGMIFIALKGENFDGHDFLSKAIENGAAAIIVSDREKAETAVKDSTVTILLVTDTLHAYLNIAGGWRRKFSLPIVAITGSNGKTTTKDLTAAVLSEKYKVLKTQKNFNSEVGVALTLLSLGKEHETAVIEMGMRGLGQIEYLTKTVRPNIGIVINVGDAHLQLLGSRENIAKAKGELPQNITKDGWVILNADNAYTAVMAAKTAARVLTFGMDEKADVQAMDIKTVDAKKTVFICKTPQGSMTMTLPLIGKHNVYDALAAIAAGCVMKIDLTKIAQGLLHFTSSGMRFELLPMHGYTVINDAYNASPASTLASLNNLLMLPAKRRILVFGDMKELGSIEEDEHRKIGQFCAAEKIDGLFTLGTLAAYAAQAAKKKGMRFVHSYDTHEEIAAQLKSFLDRDDVVLFKGSHSMQLGKIIKLLEK